jgi:class 3 adenylate cyclase
MSVQLASRVNGRSTGSRSSLPPGSQGIRCTASHWWGGSAEAAPGVVLVYGYSGPRRKRPNACHDAGRFLTTVLVTDIVGSTATATRLGDRRWREVLADHYAACRAQIERAGGELVNTTGDGVVAIFDGPARAVRAAIAIQAIARTSGIAVRAGLHAGECERLGDGLAGVAVHIAARVCALGGADDVMATGTVRDLVIGSLLAFDPRGDHELRGVPGRLPVFAATDPA